MPPIVYFVRHGQTDWNLEHRLQGQAENDINEIGREQARRNGLRLKDLIEDPAAFDFVASPMRRTRETMEIVRAAMGLDPGAYRTDARLVEIHFGDWQGYTLAELDAREPGTSASRAQDKWRFLPPGKNAESYEMLSARVRPWFEALERPTVCVTHGGVMRVIIRAVEKALGGSAAAMLNIPQDRVLRLENGRLEWL